MMRSAARPVLGQHRRARPSHWAMTLPNLGITIWLAASASRCKRSSTEIACRGRFRIGRTPIRYFLTLQYGSMTSPVRYSAGSRITSVLVSLN